jgi:hypothetical protein
MRTSLKKPKSETLPVGDDVDWLRRSQLWQKRALALAHGRVKRERPRTPLILSGHGVRLRIDNNALVIRNGWIILLDGSAIISFDVLSWLTNQDISLVRINWQGEINCIVSRSGYSANPYRVQWQRDTSSHPAKRMEFCTPIRLWRGLTKIRRRMSPNCEHLRRMQRLHISGLGVDSRSNGAARADDKFRRRGKKLGNAHRHFKSPEIAMPRIL